MVQKAALKKNVFLFPIFMDKGASIVSHTTYWDSNNGINVDSVDCQFDFCIHMSLLE